MITAKRIHKSLIIRQQLEMASILITERTKPMYTIPVVFLVGTNNLSGTWKIKMNVK